MTTETKHRRTISQAVNVVHRWTGRPRDDVAMIAHHLSGAQMVPHQKGNAELTRRQFGHLIIGALTCHNNAIMNIPARVLEYANLDPNGYRAPEPIAESPDTALRIFAEPIDSDKVIRSRLLEATIEVHLNVPKIVVRYDDRQKLEYFDWSSPKTVDGSDLIWRLDGANLVAMHNEFQPHRH